MNYDLIIIGAGSAGYNGAALAHNLGLRVALIDGAKELGGLCILRGCMPSKALLAGVNRFHQVRHSTDFGINATDVKLDLPTLMARKDRHIADFAEYRVSQITSGRFPFIHGYAKFLDSHTLEITSGPDTGKKLTAAYFLLATGSELTPPTLPGLADIGYAWSDTVLKNPHLPASVIVLGAGAIALEFAHYYNALGSRVTILQRSKHLLKGSDFETSVSLQRALEKSGITIHTGTTLKSASKTALGKKVTYLQNDVHQEVEAEEIFYALGRRPGLDTLGLAAASITPRPVRPTQQIHPDHIFLAGDAAGPHEIVHLAIHQAEIAVRNVARLLRKLPAYGGSLVPNLQIGNALVSESPDSLSPQSGEWEQKYALETIDYRSKLFVLFTHPELAQVGLTEEGARAAGHDILTASHPFDDHGKSLVMGETDGLVKLVALSSTGEILGASVVGPEASSLIHEIVAVMHFHGTAADIVKMPHYHPTLSEIWTYPAEEIADQIAK